MSLESRSYEHLLELFQLPKGLSEKVSSILKKIGITHQVSLGVVLEVLLVCLTIEGLLETEPLSELLEEEV